jgi:Leucine-rich repeat (LRR) protein
LYGCTALKDISGLAELRNITSISISRGEQSYYNQKYQITKLPIGFDKIKNLETLDFSYSNLIKGIDSLENCKNLTTLNLQYCTSIQNVNGLKTCNNLLSVNLDECESLHNVEGLADLNNLERLRLSKCKNVKPKPSPIIMDKRKKVEKFQKRIKNLKK